VSNVPRPPRGTRWDGYNWVRHDPNLGRRSGMAITGLILAFVIPIMGVWFSVAGLAQVRRGERTGRGLAVWGIPLNIASFIFQVLFVGPLLIWLFIRVAATAFGMPWEDQPGFDFVTDFWPDLIRALIRNA